MRIFALAFTAAAVLALAEPARSQQLSAGDIVLYAGEATVVSGSWQIELDGTAAGGKKIRQPNAGAAKIAPALINPTHFFRLDFTAQAGRAYRLWVRGRADNNDYNNDSVHVQFSGSVDVGGTAIYRIGTSTSAEVVIEGCSGVGVSGWGWEDNGWCGLGALVYFAQSGSQTLQVQAREDGIAIDQIVLSPDTYLSSAPGAQRNDAVILPQQNNNTSIPEIVLHAADATVRAGNWTLTADATAASGFKMRDADSGAAKVAPALISPTHYFELQFNAESGRGYRLWLRGRADGDQYVNDSVHVQFSGSVDVNGTAAYRIGTTASAEVVIEGCTGVGVSGWGWEDNGWCGLGPLIYFAASGSQTVRIQRREDGISIDQIVLSSQQYLNTAPGAQRNDAVILSKTQGPVDPPPPPTNQSPTITFFKVAATSPASGKAPVTMNFMAKATDVEDSCCSYLWDFGDGKTSTDRNPVHTYLTGGSFTVTLVVRDGANNPSQPSTMTVSVAPPKTVPVGSETIRVMQWNLYKGRATDKKDCCEGADMDLQARWIAGLGVDVIASQEVMGGTGGQAEGYAMKLANLTGVTWYYAYAHQSSTSSTTISSGFKTPGSTGSTGNGTQGVALLSRYPLSNLAAEVLDDAIDPPFTPQPVLGATILVNGRNIAIINAHLSCCADGANDRPPEAEQVNRFINTNYSAEPRILMGDFNATSGTPEIKEFTTDTTGDPDDGQFEDAWAKAFGDATVTVTAYPNNPPGAETRTRGSRIDFVFFSRGSTILELLAAQIADTRDETHPGPVLTTVGSTDDNFVRPSDHNGVVVRFAVK